MKRHVKLFAPVLLSLMFLLMLSACGTSLQKPTGLETAENEQQEIESEPIENESIDEKKQEASGEIATETSEKTRIGKVIGDKPVVTAETEPETAVIEKKPEKSGIKSNDVVTKKPVTSETDSGKKTATPSVEKKQPVTEQAKTPAVKVPVPAPVKPVEKVEPSEPAMSKIVYSIVISSSEVPLPPTTMEIKESDTVLAALIVITKKHQIQMDYRGGQGATAYIEGMGNVYEFDRGQGSGWMYRVNGIFPDRGAGVVPLQDGDRVEWLYTTNLGVDLNANLKPFRR